MFLRRAPRLRPKIAESNSEPCAHAEASATPPDDLPDLTLNPPPKCTSSIWMRTTP